MITAKCTLHIGHKMSRAHNLRKYDRDKWNKDGHIDEERKELNEVVTDTAPEKFFDEKFGAALDEYNKTNRPKHPERLIGFANAADYDNCPADQRQARAVKAYYAEHRKDSREAIIQFGDSGEYQQIVKALGQEQADKMYCAALKAAYSEWVKDNPTLAVFSAVIHMDETTPHLHLDYLPIAESNKGLSCKVSMDGALKKLGYVREKNQKYAEKPFNKWERDYRAKQEGAFQAYWNGVKGVDVIVLPSEPTKKGVRHQDPPEYRAEQERKATIGAVMDKIKQAKNKHDHKKAIQTAAPQIIENAETLARSIVETATADIKAQRDKNAADSAVNAREKAKNTREREEIEQEREQNNVTRSSFQRRERANAAEEAALEDLRNKLTVEKATFETRVKTEVAERLAAQGADSFGEYGNDITAQIQQHRGVANGQHTR